MNLAKWFWVVVVAQASFLLGWAGWHGSVRHSAPVILLKTHPIDPSDVLRGDYLMLNYDINTPPLPADLKGVGNSISIRGGAEVCVVLVRRGSYYEAGRVTRDAPSLAPDEIWVRGTLEPWRGRVTYGIEQYYVPEGRGTPPHRARIEVEASVSSGHRLYIHRVLADGKPYP